MGDLNKKPLCKFRVWNVNRTWWFERLMMFWQYNSFCVWGKNFNMFNIYDAVNSRWRYCLRSFLAQLQKCSGGREGGIMNPTTIPIQTLRCTQHNFPLPSDHTFNWTWWVLCRHWWLNKLWTYSPKEQNQSCTGTLFSE